MSTQKTAAGKTEAGAGISTWGISSAGLGTDPTGSSLVLGPAKDAGLTRNPTPTASQGGAHAHTP